MMPKAWSSIEEVPYCFSRSYVKLQGHRAKKIIDFDQHRRGALLFFKVIRQISRSHGSKNRWIWPRLGVSGLLLQFEYTNGYEMMHRAWSSIEEVPYCFSRSSVKFQGQTALKIAEFDPDWAFPDCNSSLNSPIATKWCTKLEVALKRCPIVFQGHPSNFKVTRL